MKVVGKVVGEAQNEKGRSELVTHDCCLIGVGRTGFGNVERTAPDAGTLRPGTILDENDAIGGHSSSVGCAALLAPCAQESTAANPVVEALARAVLDWLGDADVKHLHSALLRIVGDLD
ncbi:MAG: hypothetical protein ACXVDD_00165 [Polyangia bacterium]